MSDVTQTAQILKLTGMSCEHCVATVKTALEALPGVVAASVDLADHRATVIVGAEVSRRALVEAIEKAGYGII